MESRRKYGLQIRAPPSTSVVKKAIHPPRKPSIFNQEDDDEDNVEQAIARQAAKNRALKEVELQHKAALEQDSTIFSYDEVYDDIKSTSTTLQRVEKEQGKPKYITKLLDKAKTRQQEQEIIYERKLLKERQQEDHLYGDKEKYVTSAYKQKLAEQAKWLEEERIRELQEQAEEVTNKKDLSDFYHHLLSKNVAFGAKTETSPDRHSLVEQESSGTTLESSKCLEPVKSSQDEKTVIDNDKGLDEKCKPEDSSFEGNDPKLNADGDVGPSPGIDGAEKQAASIEEPREQDGSAKDSTAGQANLQPVDRKPSEAALASAKERYLARKRLRTT